MANVELEAPISALPELVQQNAEADGPDEETVQNAPADHEEEKKPVEGEADTGKKRRNRGQNKNRKAMRVDTRTTYCQAALAGKPCQYGESCRYSHHIEEFLATKPPDLDGPCRLHAKFGYCKYGVTCRFSKSHGANEPQAVTEDESNSMPYDVMVALRKRAYTFTLSDAYFKSRGSVKKDADDDADVADTVCEPCDNGDIVSPGHEDGRAAGKIAAPVESQNDREAAQPSSEPLLPPALGSLADAETKKVDFRNKLYLAPLTTVGNLPYRRICKNYGCDITCGEMAMATNLLQGHKSEWALLRRHASEDVFGVQICGNNEGVMTRCAELIRNTTDVDFVDINCGCPIDLVFRQGAGSALLARRARLERIITGMRSVLDRPVTVKVRIGISDKLPPNTHSLLPRLRDMGVSLVTVHGRTRDQRYSKLADWNYIAKCVEAGAPMPVYGNGDILSYDDVAAHTGCNVSGYMIARGALIKPWVFKEIKEQRIWDISADERFSMIRDYCNFGMEHWGSDNQGVEKTRRFLLEWMSFLHRYTPVGLLERPQRMNERPPAVVYRSDLEALLASPKSTDWVKISEMILGPSPKDFTFIPKHKANSYDDAQQG